VEEVEVTIAAILLFFLAAWLASQAASRWGPLAQSRS
jgi:hypothetical protein